VQDHFWSYVIREDQEIVIIGHDIDLDLDQDDDPSPETEEAAVTVADLEVDHVIVNVLAVIVQDLRNREKRESDLEAETGKEAEEVEVETVKKKQEGHDQKNEGRIDEALDPNLVSVVGAPDQKTKVALKRVPVIAQGHVIETAVIESGAVQKRETEIQEAITLKKEDRYVKELLIIKESRG